jgi:hypothetical protein
MWLNTLENRKGCSPPVEYPLADRGYAGSWIWTTSQPKFEEHGVDYPPYQTYDLS